MVPHVNMKLEPTLTTSQSSMASVATESMMVITIPAPPLSPDGSSPYKVTVTATIEFNYEAKSPVWIFALQCAAFRN